MKNINLKNLVVLMFAAVLLSSCGLGRMISRYEQGVTFTPETNPLENHGGQVAVEIDGRVGERYFHRRAIMELTPVLKYEGGEKALTPIILRGNRTTGDGILVERRTPTTFDLSEAIAYQDAMLASELVMRARLYRQGREAAAVNLPERKVADGVINTSQRVVADYDLVLAPDKYEVETTVSRSANIYFAYMRHDLNTRLPLNRDAANAAKVAELESFIRQGWKIKSVEVNAWASPEGEVAFNEKLSENRATTTNNFVNDLFMRIERATGTSIERPTTTVTAKGEDFDGFMKVLNASDLPDRQAIANVINSQLAPAERERRIKDMTVIFAEVEKILEPLRRGEIVVTLYEPKKTNAEIARLAIEDPAQLDVEELLFAATLTDDQNTKLAIYKNAQKQFPQDFRGFNNAAYILIKQGNATEAATHIEKAKQLAPNAGAVLNNAGVVSAVKDDIVNAQAYFEAAKGQGVNTSYNIGVLMIKKGDYTAALTSFAGRTCTHNVALAHLLAGNDSAAMTNLECAKESAPVAYLKAIIGARRQNDTMVFDNLRRAIQLDPAYKEVAGKDREFIRYFEVADFQAIVR